MMDGDHFAPGNLVAMRRHYAGCRQVALVLHASHPQDRDAMEARLQTAFRHLGDHEAFSLHHGEPAEAAARLAEADAVFTGGGDTFWLLRELYETKQIPLLRERVLAGMPYGGSSAGANVTGLVIGTTNDFPVVDVPTRQALGILPAVINPHHPLPTDATGHAERTAKVFNYLKFNPGEAVLGLPDRTMVRLHGGELRVELGPVWIYRPEGRTEVATGQAIPLGALKS